MIVTIIAIIMGIAMAIGGIVPNIANGMLQQELDTALNHPKHLRVQVHPVHPSYSMLGNTVAYTEVDARDFVYMDFPIESLSLHMDRLSVDNSSETAMLKEPTQGVIRLGVTEAGVNTFLQSDNFRRLLDNIRQNQSLASQLDADLNDIQVELLPNRLLIRGNASTMGGFFTLPFQIAGDLYLAAPQQLGVRNVEATTQGRPLPPDMISAILEALNPILDLKNLSNEDMQLYFRELRLSEGRVDLVGEAKLKKLPG